MLLFLYIVGAMFTFPIVLPKGNEPPIKWWMLLGKIVFWPVMLAILIAKVFWEIFTRDVDWRL